MPTLKYDYSFDPDEPNNTAASVARFALSGGQRVLDIGSGPAIVSRYLAGEHDRQIVCVDNDVTALASLRDSGLSTVEANLEDPEWDSALKDQSFDVVILADVLEHLRDPGALLERLLSRGRLGPDGVLVVSVPNASHQSVVSELLVGDFRYAETGILDETHIRWFTLESLQRLLERSGFLIDQVARTIRPLEVAPNRDRSQLIPDTMRREMELLNHDSDVYQYVIRAVVDNGPNRAGLTRSKFEAEQLAWTKEREQLLSEATRHEAEIERLKGLVRSQQDRFAADLTQGAQEVSELRAELDRATGRPAPADTSRSKGQSELAFYQNSRGVQLAAKIVRACRRLRDRR